ncbi:MAG: regulatory protein RecX [Nitrospirae bacterium]|nr:regulatory protein RecX [Candidatus Manganitrophaceae bacterium]
MTAANYRSTASKRPRETGRRNSKTEEKESGTETQSELIDRAKQTAYRMLSYRDRSIKEIETKLAQKGYSEAVVTLVIASLKEANYLDDDRFAHQWVRLRTEHRHLGPLRLKRELQEKGLSPEITEEAIQRLSTEGDPVAPAEAALRRRFKDPASLRDMKTRQRAYAFLQRKGFTTETIFKAFKKIGAANPEID